MIIIEIGPNFLNAVGIIAFTYLFSRFLHFIVSLTPYHEIHEERITEGEHTHVS